MQDNRYDRGPILAHSHPPTAGRYARSGETILVSGIYRVHHKQHRVPHEVTLIRNEIFPPCEKCHEAVRFRLLRAAADVSSEEEFAKFGFKLFCLPVMEEICTPEAEITDEAKEVA